METSPYKSKFTVLKLTQSSKAKSMKSGCKPLKPFIESPGQDMSDSKPSFITNLFADGKFEAENLRQIPQISDFQSENLNPGACLDEEQLFSKRSPFAGLDEECTPIPVSKSRTIPKTPYKVLDAPALQDDYYLNLVDWSQQNDLVVGLQSCVYIWSATSSKVTKLYDLGGSDSVTSVSWAQRGTHLSVGTETGLVQVWDVAAQKLVRVYHGHEGRVGALAWSSSQLSSGSKDRSILNRDLRSKSEFTSQLLGHKQEVCGLRWSFDDQQLASGGNDNKLLVWCPQRQSEPLWRFTSHTAAVKALAWSPHQKGLLVSGGGTADRCIRFWNTVHGVELQSI